MKKRTRYAVTLLMCTAFLSSMSLFGCDDKSENEKDNNEENVVNTHYSLTIDDNVSELDGTYDISEILYGIFLEDINFAVDGGMYAELIKNRSFEYDNLATNGHKHGWNVTSSKDVSLSNISVSGRHTLPLIP